MSGRQGKRRIVVDGGYGTAPYPVVDIFFTENQQQSAKACNDSNNKNVRKIVKIASIF